MKKNVHFAPSILYVMEPKAELFFFPLTEMTMKNVMPRTMKVIKVWMIQI